MKVPELRQNMATKEWVIIATERAKRPEQFKSKEKEGQEPIPDHDPKCPFCPGAEDKTPPETFRIEKGGGGKEWLVRSFPNKFGALLPEGDTDNFFSGVERRMRGVGFHEVICETRLHNQWMAHLTDEHLTSVIEAYRHRFNHLSRDERVDQVIIFKNHGAAAGTSLTHPHSQVIALPVVPAHIRHRLEEAMRYFDDHGVCVICAMTGMEIEDGSRLLDDTEHFVSFIPYAAFSPFHIWIVPKRHECCFGRIGEEEMSDLAHNLRRTLRRLDRGIGNPAFNLVVNSAPLDEGRRYYHWYLSVVPRVTKSAGFELGSGMFINVGLPEESAAFLRDVNID